MAESIQPYTASRIDYLAKYLQSLLPGLNYNVASTWISSEKGVSGNVLGTTFTSKITGKQALFTYPSQEAGLRDAASWIQNRSIYTGIKSSLGQSAPIQANAIATSPWNRTYYVGVFKDLISPTGSAAPGGGASTPLTQVPTNTPTPFIDITEGKLLDLQDVTYILQRYNTTGQFDSPIPGVGAAARATFTTILSGFIGKPWNKANRDALQSQITTAADSAKPSIKFDIVGAVMFIGVILVGIALIGTGGLIALKGKA